MAAIDYTELAADALGLVQDAGRPLTFGKLATAAADPDMPWRGPSDARAPYAAQVTLPAVMVQPSSAVLLGLTTADSDFIKNASAVLIVAPTPEFTDDDLENYSEVTVDGTIYGFTGVEKLRPADVTLLYFVGLSA
jgi:hypothetical protein